MKNDSEVGPKIKPNSDNAITLSCSLIAQKRILSALQLILLFKFLKLQGLSILQTFTFS